MGDEGLVIETDCFSADVLAGGEVGDGGLTVEDDCASGKRVGNACSSPKDCSAAPWEVGDAIETLVAGPVFGASGKVSWVVTAWLSVEVADRLGPEGMVAGPCGQTHNQ